MISFSGTYSSKDEAYSDYKNSINKLDLSSYIVENKISCQYKVYEDEQFVGYSNYSTYSEAELKAKSNTNIIANRYPTAIAVFENFGKASCEHETGEIIYKCDDPSVVDCVSSYLSTEIVEYIRTLYTHEIDSYDQDQIYGFENDRITPWFDTDGTITSYFWTKINDDYSYSRIQYSDKQLLINDIINFYLDKIQKLTDTQLTSGNNDLKDSLQLIYDYTTEKEKQILYHSEYVDYKFGQRTIDENVSEDNTIFDNHLFETEIALSVGIIEFIKNWYPNLIEKMPISSNYTINLNKMRNDGKEINFQTRDDAENALKNYLLGIDLGQYTTTTSSIISVEEPLYFKAEATRDFLATSLKTVFQTNADTFNLGKSPNNSEIDSNYLAYLKELNEKIYNNINNSFKDAQIKIREELNDSFEKQREDNEEQGKKNNVDCDLEVDS